jgi:hypothetical protein
MSTARAVGLFVLLAALFTWPQVIHPFSVPANIDAYFNMWRVAWIAHQLPADPAHLFDANIYYPRTGTFLMSDAVLLQGIVALPFIKMGIPVVLVTNALVFLGFVTSGLSMFLLVRELTGKTMPAVLGGMVMAFAPFRFDHYFHLEMGWAQWMPLTFWMVHRTIRHGRWRDGLLAGLFIALQGYSSVYYLVFLAGALTLAAPILLWMAAPQVRRRAVASLAAGAVLAGLLLAPYIRVYGRAAADTGGRSRQETLTAYAAGPKHYLAANPTSVLYGTTTGTWGQHEKRLFPGFIVIALMVVALWPPIDRRRLVYLVVLVFAVDMSFAHRGVLPRWLYDHVFAFRGLRVLPRIGQLMLMAAGCLAGIGLARLIDRWSLWRIRWSQAIGLAAVVATGAEYLSHPIVLVPVSTAPSAVTEWLMTQPSAVVAEFPAPGMRSEGIPEVYYQYESTFHWRPLLNGYSGMYPPNYVEWIVDMGRFPDDEAIASLRAHGATYVVLHVKYFAKGVYQDVVRTLSARSDLVAFGPFPDGDGEARAYRLLTGGR